MIQKISFLCLIFVMTAFIGLYGQQASTTPSHCAEMQKLSSTATLESSAVMVSTQALPNRANPAETAKPGNENAKSCDPKNCDPSECDPTKCPPKNCDPADCEVKTCSPGTGQAKTVSQAAACQPSACQKSTAGKTEL